MRGKVQHELPRDTGMYTGRFSVAFQSSSQPSHSMQNLERIVTATSNIRRMATQRPMQTSLASSRQTSARSAGSRSGSPSPRRQDTARPHKHGWRFGLTARRTTVGFVDAHDGEAAALRSFSPRRRLTVAIAVFVVVAAVAAALLALLSGADGPSAEDAFYDAPDPLPDGPPGAIIRSAPIAGSPPVARAYRILYRSRGYDGRPAALSALLFVPDRPAPSNGRNVVALAHGTVGVAQRCAVSRERAFSGNLDGLTRFIRANYAVVAPDLEGLGTAGPHPYLVGEASAHATLDAVRATQRLQAADASERFIAWGVGQGGHAALFTGQEAATYAPELELAGVAAGAPMANLGRLIEASAGTPAGDVLAAYMLWTWSRVQPRLRLGDVVTAPGRAMVERVSKLCVPIDHGRIGPALGSGNVKLDYRARTPWNREPWKSLLARNSPGAKPIAAPVIVTQGQDDAFVRPAATARFVRYLCGRGMTVQYRPSRRVAHSDLGEKTAPYVSKWIARRFAGETARVTC
jgi:Secretory lipase